MSDPRIPGRPPNPDYPQYSGQQPNSAFAGIPSAARRRWPTIVSVALASAAVAATATVLITRQVAETNSAAMNTARATVTITSTPASPAPPVPLPTAQADSQTCAAWHSAGDKIRAATKAQSVIPKGMTVIDQAVRDNPDWSAAVRQAANLYSQAADALSSGSVPGTTAILGQSTASTVSALRALSVAYAAFDVANGNVYDMVHDSSDTMDVLCDRLAPR